MHHVTAIEAGSARASTCDTRTGSYSIPPRPAKQAAGARPPINTRLVLPRRVGGKWGLAPWRKLVWQREKRCRHGACPLFPPCPQSAWGRHCPLTRRSGSAAAPAGRRRGGPGWRPVFRRHRRPPPPARPARAAAGGWPGPCGAGRSRRSRARAGQPRHGLGHWPQLGRPILGSQLLHLDGVFDAERADGGPHQGRHHGRRAQPLGQIAAQRADVRAAAALDPQHQLGIFVAQNVDLVHADRRGCELRRGGPCGPGRRPGGRPP